MDKLNVVLIYFLTLIYFFLSNKIMYMYTLKYYDLFEYISDDKNSLIILTKHVLIYRIIIRYIRIHLISSSFLISLNIIIELPLIIKITNFSMLFVIIVVIYDILSLKARLRTLEDKLYRTYYNLK